MSRARFQGPSGSESRGGGRFPHPADAIRPAGGSTRGRGGGRGGKFNKAPTAADGVDEDFQISVQRVLNEFRDSDYPENVTFPATLSNTERRYVHFLANQLGLVSKSSGKGEARALTIRRKGGPAARVVHSEPELTLSGPGLALLQSYFSAWPVTAGELCNVSNPLTSLIEAQQQGGSAGAGGGRGADGRGGRRAPLVDLAARRATWSAAQTARSAHPDYPGILAGRKSLPAWASRDEVQRALRGHRVVIVCGETGCGKSTQVPQFLLDDELLGPTANVIVTQPRRISAIALAERVASERCEAVGGSVGYNVRLESATSKDTRLLFCTTGVLLRRLTGTAADAVQAGIDSSASKDGEVPSSISAALAGITHIILDEVHERELNCDFLLAILRDALAVNPGLTLVLMSATISLELFSNYFREASGPAGPSVVKMVGSAHPVTRYYLEDVLLASGYMGHGFGRDYGGSTPGGLDRSKGDSKSSNAARLAALVAKVKGEVMLPEHLVDGTGGVSSAPAVPGLTDDNHGIDMDALIASAIAVPGDGDTGDGDGPGQGRTAGAGAPSSVPALLKPSQASSTNNSNNHDVDASSLKCTLCGRARFASVEDFGVHAATCFGEPYEEEEEQTAAVVPVAASSVAVVQQQTSITSPGGTVLASSTAQATSSVPAPGPSSLLLSLPVGKKGKEIARQQKAEGSGTPVATGSTAAAAGGAATGSIAAAPQPQEEEDPELKALLDEYQAALVGDEDAIDIDLLVHLLSYIVSSAASGAARRAGGGAAGSYSAPGTPLVSTPTAGAGHTKGASHPSDAGTGAILVFLPGWEDISGAMEAIRAHPVLGSPARTLILPLHSQVPVQEQRRVFKRPPPGVTKIILSTNIAETSITIDDVVYVIDAGKVREKTYDPYTGCSALTSVWVSQASSRQRAGRAGRVRPGIAYHLFSKARHASMAAFAVPEMLRMPLEELVLQVLTLGHSDVARFLGKAVQPPAPAAVRNAVQVLMDIGAVQPLGGAGSLTAASAGPLSPTSPAVGLPPALRVTPLGRRLASMPVSPRLGVALLWSAALGCADPVVTVVACAGGRPPWVLPLVPQDRPRADRSRLALAGGARSDHWALLAAFLGFHAARTRGGGHPFSSAEVAWCRDSSISGPAMNMVTAVRAQLADELWQAGILGNNSVLGQELAMQQGPGRGMVQAGLHDRALISALSSSSTLSSSATVVTSVLAAGLYPNVARANPPSGSASGKDDDMDDGNGKKLPRMESRNSKKCLLHPSGINAVATASLGEGGSGPAPPKGSRGPPGALAGQPPDKTEWVVFEEQSTRGSFGAVMLRNTTVVQPLALVLLCGAAAAGCVTLPALTPADAGPRAATASAVAPQPARPSHVLSFETLVESVGRLLGPSHGVSGGSHGHGHGHGHARTDGQGARTDSPLDIGRVVQAAEGELDRLAALAAASFNRNDNDEDDDEDDEDSDDKAGRQVVPVPLATVLAVDSWIRLRAAPAAGILLCILRSRLAQAFTRAVVLPKSGPNTRGASASQAAGPTERDVVTFDITARLLVLEAEGPAALMRLPSLLPGASAASAATAMAAQPPDLGPGARGQGGRGPAPGQVRIQPRQGEAGQQAGGPRPMPGPRFDRPATAPQPGPGPAAAADAPAPAHRSKRQGHGQQQAPQATAAAAGPVPLLRPGPPPVPYGGPAGGAGSGIAAQGAGGARSGPGGARGAPDGSPIDVEELLGLLSVGSDHSNVGPSQQEPARGGRRGRGRGRGR